MAKSNAEKVMPPTKSQVTRTPGKPYGQVTTPKSIGGKKC